MTQKQASEAAAQPTDDCIYWPKSKVVGHVVAKITPSEAAAQPTPKPYSCCGADFAKQHEPTCHNYTTEFDHDH